MFVLTMKAVCFAFPTSTDIRPTYLKHIKKISISYIQRCLIGRTTSLVTKQGRTVLDMFQKYYCIGK